MATTPVTPKSNDESLIISNKWFMVFLIQLNKYLARWVEGPRWGPGVAKTQR